MSDKKGFAARPPSRRELLTTQGEVVIRAMTRKEAVTVRRLVAAMNEAESELESIKLEDEINAIQKSCVISGGDKLDSIEAGEYVEVVQAIGELSREYKLKN